MNMWQWIYKDEKTFFIYNVNFHFYLKNVVGVKGWSSDISFQEESWQTVAGIKITSLPIDFDNKQRKYVLSKASVMVF